MMLRTFPVALALLAAIGPARSQDTLPKPAWLPRQAADLLALDKVSAKTSPIALKLGESASFGTLTITLKACEVRPPDQPLDATAYVDVTDATPAAPAFHGWLVRSAPAVSGLQHPVYDIALAGCR